MAIRIWNLLADGNGALDWAGLPVAAEWLGVADIDGLLTCLETIKGHKPPET